MRISFKSRDSEGRKEAWFATKIGEYESPLGKEYKRVFIGVDVLRAVELRLVVQPSEVQLSGSESAPVGQPVAHFNPTSFLCECSKCRDLRDAESRRKIEKWSI